MDPDFLFIVNYPCPHCRTPLEARTGGVMTWLRCPHCGRAGLPPDEDRAEAAVVEPGWGTFDPMDAPIAAPLPIRPRPMVPRPSSTVPKSQMTRLSLGAGFFFSVAACLFALLESNATRAAVFAVAAAVFLFLLTRPVPGDRGI